jgi:hypothetical protein
MMKRHKVGVPHCSILAIQIACSADPKGELVFAIHVRQLIEKCSKGQVKLPGIMKSLLTHKSAIFINANEHNDLAALIDMFYGGKLEGIRYVKAHNLFFSSMW